MLRKPPTEIRTIGELIGNEIFESDMELLNLNIMFGPQTHLEIFPADPYIWGSLKMTIELGSPQFFFFMFGRPMACRVPRTGIRSEVQS